MRNYFIVILLIFLGLSTQVGAATEDVFFRKGVAYLLIDDVEMARRNFNQYFAKHPTPAIKNGYLGILDNKHEDATRQFRSYLDIDHRSTISIVGIALSTAHMSISNTPELLKRAIRLDPNYSPAYLALGQEYVKQKNFPSAEERFRRAYSIHAVPEYKIPLARMYLDRGQPGQVLELLKSEADNEPDNFYFNYLTARAYLQLNRLEEMGPYIEAAREAKPESKGAKLLTAKYYLFKNNPQRARVILRGLKFEKYNEDFQKTFAHTLVKLKDKKARKYLYEVFSRKPWDRDINLLLGNYNLWMEKGANVQNWIYRALLSGADPRQVKEVFPDSFKFPEHFSFPLFEARKIAWLSEKDVLAVAIRKSGEPERIYIFDAEKKRITQTMSFDGEFQDLYMSKMRNRVIISSTAEENKKVFLYALEPVGSGYRIRRLIGRALDFPVVTVGFNSAGSLAYITDKRIEKLALESPFAEVDHYGQKKFVYHTYPFRVFKYNFNTNRMTSVSRTDMAQLENTPIPAVRRYTIVSNAALSNSPIQKLLEKGQQLDITSSEVVKIVFSKYEDAFVIYLGDVENAFKGFIYDSETRKASPVDETTFLGEKEYAVLDILDLNVERKELLVATQDTQELILYNYENQWHIPLAAAVYKVFFDRDDRLIYVLNKRDNKMYFSGANLQVIYLDPYLNKKLGVRVGLEDVVRYVDETEVYFSTTSGEIMKMNHNFKFNYLKPSMEGCIHEFSPSGDYTAAFINDRMFIIE